MRVHLSGVLRGAGWWQTLEVSGRAAEPKRAVELHCEDGVAVLGGGWDEHVTVYRDGPEGVVEERIQTPGELPSPRRAARLRRASSRRAAAALERCRGRGRCLGDRRASSALARTHDRRDDSDPDVPPCGAAPVLRAQRARPGGRLGRGLRRRGRRRGRHAGRARAVRRRRARSLLRLPEGGAARRAQPPRGAPRGDRRDRLLPLRRRPAAAGATSRRCEDCSRTRTWRTPALAWIDLDGTLNLLPRNMGRPGVRRAGAVGTESIGLTGAAHTLAGYRRLPHGWRTTPADEHTDHHMWLQWLGIPGSVARRERTRRT